MALLHVLIFESNLMKMYTYSLAAVLSVSVAFSVQAMDGDLAASSICDVRIEVPEVDREQEVALAELILTVTEKVPGFDVAQCPAGVFLGAYILSILGDSDVARDGLSILVDNLGYSPLSAPRFSVWVLEVDEAYFWSQVKPSDLQALNRVLKGC